MVDAVAADVDDMRIDRRAHRGNWCNVKDTGVGERPKANPDPTRSYLDAFVFVKPPGDSDGTSDSTATTPNSEGKRFDPKCGSSNVDALSGAPHAGGWFHPAGLAAPIGPPGCQGRWGSGMNSVSPGTRSKR